MMDQKPEAKSLSLADYESIIAKYPLFYLLNHKDIRELAHVAKEIKVNAGTVITKEGDIVDSVYLIVSGKAKVTREVKLVDKPTTVDIATLKKGDAIGLAGTGYFSRLGIRTADVTAIEPMVLLSFDVRDFQNFLQRPGVAYPALKNAGDQILLMNFIQQSHLFKDLPIDKIQALARIIKKINVKAGSTIYKEGTFANEFYFIAAGSVVLITQREKETIARLYESYTVLGMEEYTERAKHPATARAETDCDLFVLTRRQIEHVETLPAPSPETFLTSLWNRFKAFLTEER